MGGGDTTAEELGDGTAEKPLRVMLVPSEVGATTVERDFKPVFDLITKNYHIHFSLTTGADYSAVVNGMCYKQVDIAFYGAVTLHEAKERGCADLLAVAVEKGQSIYYSGIYVRKDSGIKSIADLEGKAVAFGDPKSTSSFNFPVAMLINAGIDPAKDLGKIVMAGSHSASMAALAQGQVDACAASFNTYEKMINDGTISEDEIIPLAKSDPIPYPPLAMHSKLPGELKTRLRDAFNGVHESDGAVPEMILGYGGKQVDRYDANYPVEEFDKAISKLAKVTDDVKDAMIKKAGEQ